MSRKIICTHFCNGKKHDFKLFKKSKIHWINKVLVLADSGYTGINKIRKNVKIPRKKSKKKPLSREDKKNNREISSQRVVNENVIGYLKRFKIISDRYRNRRKRFGLRLNLIAGICNRDMAA